VRLAGVVKSGDKRRVTKVQSYAAVFLSHVTSPSSWSPAHAAAPANDPAGLEDAIRERLEAGRRAWPDVALDPEAFVRHLATHQSGELPPLANIGDLYLACACAHAIPRAIAIFQRDFLDVIARAARRVDSSATFVEEVGQVVFEKLLTAPARETPKIADYAGRAALRSWLSVTATRTALNLRRTQGERAQARTHDELGSGIAALGAGALELDYLKRRYKPAFEAALRVALQRLDVKDRALLRLNLGDGLSIDRLAAMYRVGRSTAARWLSQARASLLDETRRELVRALDITASEFESIAALVRSDLEVSVVRLLDTSPKSSQDPNTK
jgi:RNA polymerase sigma-70 factor (ECF subfamily)